MTSEQIITNIIFTKGLRTVLMGAGDNRAEFNIGCDVGALFDDNDGTLPFLSQAMEVFSRGLHPMHIVVRRAESGLPIVYRFQPLGGTWMPVDEDQVRINFSSRDIGNFVADVMTE